MKIRKKISKIFSLLSTVVLGVAAFIFPMNQKTAFAAETEKIVTDFTRETSDWNYNDFAIADKDGLTLIAGASASTKGNSKQFLAFFTVNSITENLTISFSEGCALALTGNKVIATGLQTTDEQTTIVLPKKLDDVELIKLEVMSDYAELSIKRKSEPYDYLGTPVATFYTKDSLEAKPIALSVEKGVCVLQGAKIYTLQGSISIETENYVPPVIVEEEEPKTEEKGCKSTLNVLPATMITLGGLVAAVGSRRRKED